jgi:hypothetical protein
MAQPTSRDIEAGGVRLNVEYRTFGGDRGPAVRVYAEIDGRPVQLLRFDCFDNDPHYHYDPDGRDDHRKLHRQEVPDPVAWTLAQLSGNVVSMIRTAGYDAVADRVDPDAVTEAIPQVEAAIRDLTRAAATRA